MLRELVPPDVLRDYTPDDWKKAIMAQFNCHSVRTKEEAKTGFLKCVSRYQTFGSAFFEVKVERDFPVSHYPLPILAVPPPAIHRAQVPRDLADSHQQARSDAN